MSELYNQKIIELGHPHHPNIPHHPLHSPFMYALSRMHGDVQYEEGVTTANDLITTGTHTGTHIDALGHVACNGEIHGHISIEQHQSKTEGVAYGGVETIQPILTKAHLIDVSHYVIKGQHKINRALIERVVVDRNIKIKQGDAVFIRTGWDVKFKNTDQFIPKKSTTPGVTLCAVDYLLDLGMTLTGSDTMAYEYIEGSHLPVHKKLLVDCGIHIIEMLNLEELYNRKIQEFTFICLPLRIVGGTGSPIRPIALISKGDGDDVCI